ncbi:VCBS domain-containing protein, partial [Mesorhizobium sp. B4-1-1]|uniref:VCBS domain-containing protein n=1 Tax=Mesorhizobium sp. B4-1-1 TaxID=2589890 RepID=UPI001AED457E
MATTTVSGSTVTFSNSGAAADLTQSGTEDGSLQFTFDVLAASGGGTKTTIYSVDDGTKNDDGGAGIIVTNKAFADYNKDLLIQDVSVSSVAAATETTQKGATIWIGTDGKIHYDASSLSAEIQALGANQTFTDTFQYTIKMSNGTLSVATLTVVINGVNDAAAIGTPTVVDVTEDSASPTLTASGAISISDVDQNQSSFQTTVSGDAGNLGSLTLAANGSYTYSVANAAVQYLGENDTKIDTFTVTALDGTTKQVSFTIHGVNDAAAIGTPTVVDVTEDSASPTLT